MDRIIIENRSVLTLHDAVAYVLRVIADGRVSNGDKQHCYATRFDKCLVWTHLNKGSERFVVED